uniref:60S ribosomal protein L29 n=1 Tax=Spermophilus dauricus TaxID=99837 RepID=A0A8C9QIV3_SPEDA
MTKSKNHTINNQSPKWHRNGIKKYGSQRYESPKEVDPKFLRNMNFAKKQNKKSLKNMQVNNAKAIKACAKAVKALVKPKEVKPKMPKGASHKLDHLALLAHPRHGKYARTHMARDCRLSWPKAKGQAQAKTQAATPAPVSAPALAPAPVPKGTQTLKGAQVPVKGPQ